MAADIRLEVRSCEVNFMKENTVGYVVCELFDLFPDVAEKFITEPTLYNHDGEVRNSYKVHCHGGFRSDGVGADVKRFKS